MTAVIEYFRWCASNDFFEVSLKGSNGRYYMVSRAPYNPGSYGMNWKCECRGFKYRGKCKHIARAETMRCGHGEDAVMGSPAADIQNVDKCPKCFGPTSTVKVAV